MFVKEGNINIHTIYEPYDTLKQNVKYDQLVDPTEDFLPVEQFSRYVNYC